MRCSCNPIEFDTSWAKKGTVLTCPFCGKQHVVTEDAAAPAAKKGDAANAVGQHPKVSEKLKKESLLSRYVFWVYHVGLVAMIFGLYFWFTHSDEAYLRKPTQIELTLFLAFLTVVIGLFLIVQIRSASRRRARAEKNPPPPQKPDGAAK
jgi:hypothetical protein